MIPSPATCRKQARNSLGLMWLCAIALVPRVSMAADQFSATRETLYSAYAGQLHELAASCDAEGLKPQAEFTRRWLPRRDPTMLYVFALPENGVAPSGLTESSAAHDWWDRFQKLRHAQAEKLFELAESAAKAKQPALALELAREAVRENPDLEQGRKALGEELHGGRWVSADTARRLQAGQVWSEKFGWLPADQLARYEGGMRFYRGHWIDAAEDARLHSNIYNGWRVETEHYSVITNHSLEEGVRLSRRLEMLYDVWRQVFLGYYATPAQVEQWFGENGVPPAGAPRKQHQVVYFRDKDQYVNALQAAEPQIAKTLGFYSNSAKTAYFFAGDEQYAGTLYHEATHQLFREVRAGAVDPGKKNNFWIVEAVACYMESLAEHRLWEDEPYGMYTTLGGENEGRVPAARKRLLDDHFYVPLRELTTASMQELQHDARLPMVYSQISGQALFLMHADAARYRPVLMNYLIAVYTGHADPNSLEKLSGVKYEELDRQYREFMQ